MTQRGSFALRFDFIKDSKKESAAHPRTVNGCQIW